MKSQEQSERDTCRVIVFNPDRTEVLVRENETYLLFFPSIEIPRWERVAENLTVVLKSELGCEAISLFAADTDFPETCLERVRYEAMECRCAIESHSGSVAWRSMRGLTRTKFRHAEDQRALARCVRELNSCREGPASSFSRIGWFSKLQSWVAAIIGRAGLELTGVYRQFNAGASFSLIRFETSGPAVWFKPVGEPNQREFPITLKLSQQFPQHLPKLLGVRTDWNGWLSFEAGGTNLGETEEIGLWQSAAESLAKLQIESITKTDPILHAGARDLRPATLAERVPPFVSVITQLMEEQAKVPPAVLSRHELSLLSVRIADSLTLLEDLGLPEVLGHSDLNPGKRHCLSRWMPVHRLGRSLCGASVFQLRVPA